MSKKLIVGIDEVGRGSVAGPVSVGIVVCEAVPEIPGLTDSKKMTEKARLRVSALASEMQSTGQLRFGIYSVPAGIIDSGGISRAIASAIARGLSELAPDASLVKVFLDGSLKAPREYEQTTIIGGDLLVPAISLASVVAKVERDRYMAEEAHAAYPNYGFDRHKGYGTAAHLAAIKTYGLSPIHRRSFLTKFMVQ